MTDTEAYFLGQIGGSLEAGEEVLASGYFRTNVSARGVGAFLQAANARGYFMALTSSRLWMVETRAPATSRPLLENLRVTSVSLDGLRASTDGEALRLHGPELALELELSLSNAHLPQQAALVELLSTKCGDGSSVAQITQARQNKRLVRALLVLLVAAAGIVLAFLAR